MCRVTADDCCDRERFSSSCSPLYSGPPAPCCEPIECCPIERFTSSCSTSPRSCVPAPPSDATDCTPCTPCELDLYSIQYSPISCNPYLGRRSFRCWSNFTRPSVPYPNWCRGRSGGDDGGDEDDSRHPRKSRKSRARSANANVGRTSSKGSSMSDAMEQKASADPNVQLFMKPSHREKKSSKADEPADDHAETEDEGPAGSRKSQKSSRKSGGGSNRRSSSKNDDGEPVDADDAPMDEGPRASRQSRKSSRKSTLAGSKRRSSSKEFADDDDENGGDGRKSSSARASSANENRLRKSSSAGSMDSEGADVDDDGDTGGDPDRSNSAASASRASSTSGGRTSRPSSGDDLKRARFSTTAKLTEVIKRLFRRGTPYHRRSSSRRRGSSRRGRSRSSGSLRSSSPSVSGESRSSASGGDRRRSSTADGGDERDDVGPCPKRCPPPRDRRLLPGNRCRPICWPPCRPVCSPPCHPAVDCRNPPVAGQCAEPPQPPPAPQRCGCGRQIPTHGAANYASAYNPNSRFALRDMTYYRGGHRAYPGQTTMQLGQPPGAVVSAVRSERWSHPGGAEFVPNAQASMPPPRSITPRSSVPATNEAYIRSMPQRGSSASRATMRGSSGSRQMSLAPPAPPPAPPPYGGYREHHVTTTNETVRLRQHQSFNVSGNAAAGARRSADEPSRGGLDNLNQSGATSADFRSGDVTAETRHVTSAPAVASAGSGSASADHRDPDIDALFEGARHKLLDDW